MVSALTHHIRTKAIWVNPKPAVLAVIETMLKKELKRRGIFSIWPQVLGYPDFSSPKSPKDKKDFLHSLILESYAHAVIDYYDALKEKSLIAESIDGMVVINIKRFITARQRSHDPVGFAVYKNLSDVLRVLCEKGLCSFEPDDELPTKITVVRFGKVQKKNALTQANMEDLLKGDPAWSGLLMNLAHVQRRKLSEPLKGVKKTLANLLHSVVHKGVNEFRFIDLLDFLKTEARSVSSTVVMDTSTIESLAGLDALSKDIVEDAEFFIKLEKQVFAAINRQHKQKTVKKRLALLWREAAAFLISGNGETINVAELARIIGIPAKQAYKDWPIIKGLVEKECRKMGINLKTAP